MSDAVGLVVNTGGEDRCKIKWTVGTKVVGANHPTTVKRLPVANLPRSAQTMATDLLDLAVPGLGSALALLNQLYTKHSQLKEGKELCINLH